MNNTPVPSLYQLQHLIPLESANGEDQVKIVIGHNVAYDRSRVREQYLRKVKIKKCHELRFLLNYETFEVLSSCPQRSSYKYFFHW